MNTNIIKYRKLYLKDLETNKKYRFYKLNNGTFTAIFDSVMGDILVVRDYQDDVNNNSSAIKTIPKNLIHYIESENFKILINNFFV